MKIALLNEKIIFQKSAVQADEIGNRKNVWEDYFSCFATIGGENGNEKAEAGQTLENVDATFTVRYCKAVSDINSVGYRIIFKGEVYDIVSVDHMNYRKKSMKFRCRKVRR